MCYRGRSEKAVGDVRVIAIDPRASTVHWRFAEPSGRQLVLEIVDGKCRFYENKLGVLTNSPDFEWQLTNLNNYVNLFPGTAPAQRLGNLSLKSFGAGSGFLGIPGDVTPPSRLSVQHFTSRQLRCRKPVKTLSCNAFRY